MATTKEIEERKRRQPILREAAERLKNLIEGEDPDPRDTTPDKKWDMLLNMTREDYRREPEKQKWKPGFSDIPGTGYMHPEDASQGGWFVPDFYAHRLVTLGQKLGLKNMTKFLAMPAGFQIMTIQGMIEKGCLI